MWSAIRRLATGACGVIITLSLGIASQAQAANVLILTTEDQETAAVTGAFDSITNLVKEFTLPGNTVVHIPSLGTANAVTDATFSATKYDLVLVAQLDITFEPGNLAAIKRAIKNRSAGGFALFYDTGGVGAAADMNDMLYEAAGFRWSSATAVGGDDTFQLNTNSPYQASFSGLNVLRGGYYFYMNQIPAPNVLYMRPGYPLPASGAEASVLVDNVYSVFVPATQSYAGTGACLIASSDISMFESRNYYANTADYNSTAAAGVSNNSGIVNQGKIAPAFSSALAPRGACVIPASIDKQFNPKTVGPGDDSTLTITIGNSGQAALTGVNVTDNLVAPLVVGNASQITNTCVGGTLTATAGASVISLAGASAPIGGCQLTVPVRWPVANAAECVAPNNSRTNTITSGTDFTTDQGHLNAVTTDTLTCEAGSLSVSKHVDWQPGSVQSDLSGTAYPMVVNCTSASGDVQSTLSTSVTVDASGNGTQTITPVVSSGTCTVSETTRPAAPLNHQWVEATLPVAVVNMQPGPASNAANITNTLARASVSIALVKNVIGAPVAGINAAFGFTANCSNNQSYTGQVVLTAASSGTGVIAAVPQGVDCSVSEDATLPVPPANYTWGAMPAAQTSNNVQASGAALTFVNTLTRNLASIALTKTVTGGPSAGVTGVFHFQASCDADGTFPGDVTLSAASSGTGSIAGVPAGANCTVSELASLPSAPAGLTWGALPASQALGNVQSASSSASFINTLSSAPVVSATAVPTLGQWALMLLSTVLAGLAAVGLRRGRLS